MACRVDLESRKNSRSVLVSLASGLPKLDATIMRSSVLRDQDLGTASTVTPIARLLGLGDRRVSRPLNVKTFPYQS